LRGRVEAYEFLQQYVRDYDGQDLFWKSLKVETWPWHLFVLNDPLAGHFRGDPVYIFGVTWKAGDFNGAVFYGECLSDTRFHITVASTTQVHWNWDDLKWS
jgi:hypothetical protein